MDGTKACCSWRKPMSLLRVTRWTGIIIAASGAALMGYSGRLSLARVDSYLPFGLHMHANWLLLAGIAALIGGGLLIQITWNN
jgi:hypothetical protein